MLTATSGLPARWLLVGSGRLNAGDRCGNREIPLGHLKLGGHGLSRGSLSVQLFASRFW